MPIMVRKQATCLFIHIPKCGGTALMELVRAARWKDALSLENAAAGRSPALPCTPQHYHWEMLRPLVVPEALDAIVTITRHPFARFVSEYGRQVKTGMAQAPRDAWAETALDAYEQDPFAYDNHLRPQDDFVPAPMANLSVFRMEDKGVARAFRRVQATAAAPRQRKILEAMPVVGRSSRAGPLPDDLAHLAGRLRRVYAADFERFGYDA